MTRHRLHADRRAAGLRRPTGAASATALRRAVEALIDRARALGLAAAGRGALATGMPGISNGLANGRSNAHGCPQYAFVPTTKDHRGPSRT